MKFFRLLCCYRLQSWREIMGFIREVAKKKVGKCPKFQCCWPSLTFSWRWKLWKYHKFHLMSWTKMLKPFGKFSSSLLLVLKIFHSKWVLRKLLRLFVLCKNFHLSEWWQSPIVRPHSDQINTEKQSDRVVHRS